MAQRFKAISGNFHLGAPSRDNVIARIECAIQNAGRLTTVFFNLVCGEQFGAGDAAQPSSVWNPDTQSELAPNTMNVSLPFNDRSIVVPTIPGCTPIGLLSEYGADNEAPYELILPEGSSGQLTKGGILVCQENAYSRLTFNLNISAPVASKLSISTQNMVLDTASSAPFEVIGVVNNIPVNLNLSSVAVVSNSSVASLLGPTIVRGNGLGETTVTVTAGGQTTVFTVTVRGLGEDLFGNGFEENSD